MGMIPIPSESCPHCRKSGTYCEMYIIEVPKTREVEDGFLRDMGKRFQDNKIRINEAYIPQKIVCRNK